MSDHRTVAAAVVVLALTTRLFGVFLTVLFGFNPYAQTDVNAYADVADFVATNLLSGTYAYPPDMLEIEILWGSLIAPFWMIPGPSELYATLFFALCSTIAVYNVYLITLKLHSTQAAFIATLPIIFYPSYVFVHSTILRDPAILFALTTCVRLLVVPPARVSKYASYAVAGGFLYLAYLLRADNLPIFALAFATYVVVKYRTPILRELMTASKFTKFGLAIASVVAVLLFIPIADSIVSDLHAMRSVRATGRTDYLRHVSPDTLGSAFVFSWIGALYFLITPLPWMVDVFSDLIVYLEAIGNLLFLIFMLFGMKHLSRSHPNTTLPLFVAFLVAATIYGFVTVNFGTGIRHRQQMLWILYIFGAVGFSHKYRLKGSLKETLGK